MMLIAMQFIVIECCRFWASWPSSGFKKSLVEFSFFLVDFSRFLVDFSRFLVDFSRFRRDMMGAEVEASTISYNAASTEPDTDEEGQDANRSSGSESGDLKRKVRKLTSRTDLSKAHGQLASTGTADASRRKSGMERCPWGLATDPSRGVVEKQICSPLSPQAFSTTIRIPPGEGEVSPRGIGPLPLTAGLCRGTAKKTLAN